MLEEALRVKPIVVWTAAFVCCLDRESAIASCPRSFSARMPNQTLSALPRKCLRWSLVQRSSLWGRSRAYV
jgi:hypothetical protein